jgi:hypothetical protein
MNFAVNKLPSMGPGYPRDSFRTTLGIESLMDLSEAATLNDEAAFVRAICKATAIPMDVMTTGDFYFITLLLRIHSFSDTPIKWETTCLTPRVEIPENVWADESTRALMESLGINRVTTMPRDEIVPLFARLDEALKKPLDISAGTGLCRQHNSIPLTEDVLVKSATYLTEPVVFAEGFTFPKAKLIPEWKAMSKNPQFEKLLPFVVWLDDSYGVTIAEKFEALKAHDNAGALIEQAAVYQKQYMHGPSVVMTGICSACANDIKLRPIAINSSLFFV